MTTQEQTPAFWIGRLAMAVGTAATFGHRDPKVAQKELKTVFEEFMNSPVPSEELRKMLREYLR